VTSADRRPLVVGNWKLHKTLAESCELARSVLECVAGAAGVEVVIAPVFTALSNVRDVLRGSTVGLAAQDSYWEAQGAFTGEVSAALLRDVGCTHVIVGHSERRQFFTETDETVRRKSAAVLAAGMTPIVCVGESLAQRETGQTEAHVLGQVDAALAGLTEPEVGRLVLAYEPIWAIGTGRNASPADADQVHQAIRGRLATHFGRPLAERVRILYGGSVNSDNALALMAQPDIDGALVGGASLTAASFSAIVSAASAQARQVLP
jgi:triosephosphate isomerase